MGLANSIPSPPADGGAEQKQPSPRRWVVAAVVLTAATMDLLDATIVNVAGPSIRGDLGGGASTLQWLGASYTLAFAVLLIAGARLGDIFGRRRLFLAARPASRCSPPRRRLRRRSVCCSGSAPCKGASGRS